MYLLLLIVIVSILSYFNYLVRSSRLREVVHQYPPCFSNIELPIIGSLYNFINKKASMKTLLRLGDGASKAGGIGRMYGCFKYYLVLTDVNDMEEALSNYLEKDFIYTFLQIITGNGSIFVLDSSKSKVRRKAILPGMSPKRIANYIPSMWSEVQWLTDSLDQFVGKGPVAVEKYLSGFCFNFIICALGVQEMKEQVPSPFQMLSDFNRSFSLIYKRMTSVWIYSDFVYSFTNDFKETMKYVATFYDYANKGQEMRRNKIARHNSLAEDTKDKGEMEYGILDGLISCNVLSRKDINEEALIAIGASDEASVAMGFTLLLLAQYPLVQDKLYEEIQDIFGDTERPPDKDDLMKMTYLDMVIKESMRLYPPVPFVLRKTEKEIKLSSGKIIPAGVGLAALILGTHRNPKHWGSDAEHFDPERFRPGRSRVPDGVHIVPFGYGPRSCPAYKFATCLVKVGIIGILRKYKVVGTPAPSPIPTIRARVDVVLKSVDHVELQLENRR